MTCGLEQSAALAGPADAANQTMSNDTAPPASGPPYLPLDQWITYRFGLVASRVGRFIAPMYRTRHGLKIWEWRALAVIARFEPLSAKELAEHSSSDPINVARAIRSLTGKALISRTAAPHDRRRAVLTLTEAGRAMHADVERTALQIEQILRETMTEAEQATLARALDLIDERIAERLQRMDWRELVDGGA